MMMMILVMIGMIITSRQLSSLRTVLVRNQTVPVLLVEGRTVRMSCRTERQWFFCLWYSPLRDKQCAIQYNQPESVCGKSEKTKLLGKEDRCDIELQVCGKENM